MPTLTWAFARAFGRRSLLDSRSVRGYHREVALADETLEATLAAEGWLFERLDAITLRSNFTAPAPRTVRFFLRLTSDWLFLAIIPFAVLPDDQDAEYAPDAAWRAANRLSWLDVLQR